MNHSDLPPELKTAYEIREDTQEPPEWLRERTIRSLKERGLLGRTRWRLPALSIVPIASAAAIGFLLGFGVTQSTSELSRSYSVAPTVESALERVQRTGSAHARALQDLVAHLDSAEGQVLMEAQQVYLAASRAQRTEAKALITVVDTPRNFTDGRASTSLPIVWF